MMLTQRFATDGGGSDWFIEYDDPEIFAEKDVMCMEETTSTTSSSTSTTKTEELTPTATPREIGDPAENQANCYNDGKTTTHIRMDNTASDFCNELADVGPSQGNVIQKRDDQGTIVMDENFAYDRSYTLSGVYIEVNFAVKPGCQWTYNYDECRRYLAVTIDSCNCAYLDKKQGGIVENSCYSWRMDPNHMF